MTKKAGKTMAHWEHRDEPGWKKVRFNQPYAKGLKRLREEVLGKTDFDPATLWQWGTMQGMALIGLLKTAERQFDEAGQKMVYEVLRGVGLDIGRQILDGAEIPPDMGASEFISFYATMINRVAYASLEEARIDGPDQASFDIVWCPHQDHYRPFDCRVQRYLVQGMIDAVKEKFPGRDQFQVRFDCTIPSGSKTCHFTLWRATPEETEAWENLTRTINEKALEKARAAKK